MSIVIGLIAGTTALASIMTMQSVKGYRRFKKKTVDDSHHDRPSVSVCIAARNETHALAECLQRVLASEYEKLEVIVYDDTSEDDTSLIVKSYAHAGVRFVEGETLPTGWLGRNYAFDTLAREANGTLILMMNVDVYITPTTITEVVDYLLDTNMDMVSVIPGRSSVWKNSVVFGVLYYYWQLLLSTKAQPAASEALWMIRRKTLIDGFGGLLSINNKLLVGYELAKRLGTHRYHCLLNTDELGVTWEKKLSTQRELSVRELYPLAGETIPGFVAALGALLLLAIPPLGVIAGIITGDGVATVAWLVLELWLMSLYGWYTTRVWAKWAWLGGIVWPYVVVQELVLLVVSVIKHKTRRVTWKGRSLYEK